MVISFFLAANPQNPPIVQFNVVSIHFFAVCLLFIQHYLSLKFAVEIHFFAQICNCFLHFFQLLYNQIVDSITYFLSKYSFRRLFFNATYTTSTSHFGYTPCSPINSKNTIRRGDTITTIISCLITPVTTYIAVNYIRI